MMDSRFKTLLEINEISNQLKIIRIENFSKRKIDFIEAV